MKIFLPVKRVAQGRIARLAPILVTAAPELPTLRRIAVRPVCGFPTIFRTLLIGGMMLSEVSDGTTENYGSVQA
jgi:hypothetical protein